MPPFIPRHKKTRSLCQEQLEDHGLSDAVLLRHDLPEGFLLLFLWYRKTPTSMIQSRSAHPSVTMCPPPPPPHCVYSFLPHPFSEMSRHNEQSCEDSGVHHELGEPPLSLSKHGPLAEGESTMEEVMAGAK